MSELQRVLQRKIGPNGFTLRVAQDRSGVSFNTLNRMRHGTYESRSVRSFLKACEWAGVDPRTALASENVPSDSGCGRFYDTTKDRRALIRCDAESLCPDCATHPAPGGGA